LIGFSMAAIQIFLMIDVGLINGFGSNPLSSTPTNILLNVILIGTMLSGIEMSRSYIIKASKSHRPELMIALVAIFYTFVYVSLFDLIYAMSFLNRAFSVEFIGATLIPIFTANLFVTFLALLGGPIAAWSYMVPLYVLNWFSPILPDLPWGFQALVGSIPPLMGFIYINYVITPRDFIKAGVKIKINPKERVLNRKREKSERSTILGWAIIAGIGVSLIYFSVGLLPVYPVVPISGSMRPTFDVGDMALLQKVPVASIKSGDIIEYLTAQAPVIHRVISTKNINGQTFFLTQGDANSVPDSQLVSTAQVRGKLLMVIPTIGWFSIYMKEALIMVWGFVTTTIGAIALLAVAVFSGTYSVYRYRSQPKWKRLRRSGF